MAVHNGADWLEAVLRSLVDQTGATFTLSVWDNGSTDGSVAVIERLVPSARIVRSTENIGFWAAIERLSESCTADLMLALTDVQLAPDFLARCADGFADPEVGAVEAKLYQLRDGQRTTVIDTVGFHIDRSRRITIAGHGDLDTGQYDRRVPVFAVEGAAPMFRTRAFRDVAIDGHVIDPAFRNGPLGYGDDLDLAWRMALLGWRQLLVPEAVGWHDRSTTHDVADGMRDHVGRIAARKAIPIEKRMLDWVNVRAAAHQERHDVGRAAGPSVHRDARADRARLHALRRATRTRRDTAPRAARAVNATATPRGPRTRSRRPAHLVPLTARPQGTKRPRNTSTEMPRSPALETASAAG